MSIDFRCHHCDRQLRAKDESAGKKTRCPTCATVQPIPQRTAATRVLKTPPIARPQSEVQIPAGDIPVVRTPTIVDTRTRTQRRRGSLSAEGARGKLIVPAVGMIVCAVIGCCVGLFVMIPRFVMLATGRFDLLDAWAWAFIVVPYSMEVFVIFGSVQMLQLRNHTLAVIAAIFTIICGLTTLLLPTPFAIWALIVLYDERVREHFR